MVNVKKIKGVIGWKIIYGRGVYVIFSIGESFIGIGMLIVFYILKCEKSDDFNVKFCYGFGEEEEKYIVRVVVLYVDN